MYFARYLAPTLVAFMLGAITLAGCNQANEYKAPPPPEVTVAKPVSREVNEYLEFTGYTRATQSVDIRARVSGYLKRIEFEDGAMVKKGDLLFVIEQEPFQLALAAAKANLQKANAALELATAELRRTEPLAAKGALTQQELDLKIADKATADANVAAAKAAVDQADWNLQYTEITSPVTGRTGRHMVDIGNLVQAETTLLTKIEAYKPIYTYFTVSENDMVRLRAFEAASKAANKTSEAPVLYMGLANEQDYPHEGRLDFEETGVDPSTGTQMRRGVFANDDLSILPGMFVRVRMPVGLPKPQLLISERALAADQRGDYVLVVNDKDVVEYRPVKLGITVEGMRVVREGLQAGDWVVVNGVQRARPGAPVKPLHAEEKPAAAQTASTEAPTANTNTAVAESTPANSPSNTTKAADADKTSGAPASK